MSWNIGRFTFKKYIIRTCSRAPFPYSEGCKKKRFFHIQKNTVLDHCLFMVEVDEVKARLRIINSPHNLDQSLKGLAP